MRVLENERTGLNSPAGLAFSNKSMTLQVTEALRAGQDASLQTDVTRLDSFAMNAGSSRVMAGMKDPINMAYDGFSQRLLLLQSADTHLAAVYENEDGSLDSNSLQRYNIKGLGLQQPQGMAVDSSTGLLYILDAAGPRILRVAPAADGSFDDVAWSVIDLNTSGIAGARGLAYQPGTGSLFVVSAGDQKLYELDTLGTVLSVRDLEPFGLSEPQALVFAPSGDLTDDPSILDLFIADSGSPSKKSASVTTSGKTMAKPAALDSTTQNSGKIVELSLVEPVIIATTDAFTSSVVRTVNMANLNPPSPDPSGVTYLPFSNSLLVTDGEVEEVTNNITHFRGANVWEMTLSGSIIRTTNVSKISPTLVPMVNEPTGVAYNPSNGLYYITDDDAFEVFILNPGVDRLPGTGDDTWTSFDTAKYNNGDPEGVAIDTWNNRVVVADGVNREVYIYSLTGTLLSQFDVNGLGISDPESVEF